MEREIKNRKQRFGVEVYELMEQLEVDNELSVEDKETKIRLSFDRARKDIAVIQAKIECKREEMGELEEKNSMIHNKIPANLDESENIQGQSNHIMMTAHPDDMTEMEHGMKN